MEVFYTDNMPRTADAAREAAEAGAMVLYAGCFDGLPDGVEKVTVAGDYPAIVAAAEEAGVEIEVLGADEHGGFDPDYQPAAEELLGDKKLKARKKKAGGKE